MKGVSLKSREGKGTGKPAGHSRKLSWKLFASIWSTRKGEECQGPDLQHATSACGPPRHLWEEAAQRSVEFGKLVHASIGAKEAPALSLRDPRVWHAGTRGGRSGSSTNSRPATPKGGGSDGARSTKGEMLDTEPSHARVTCWVGKGSFMRAGITSTSQSKKKGAKGLGCEPIDCSEVPHGNGGRKVRTKVPARETRLKKALQSGKAGTDGQQQGSNAAQSRAQKGGSPGPHCNTARATLPKIQEEKMPHLSPSKSLPPSLARSLREKSLSLHGALECSNKGPLVPLMHSTSMQAKYRRENSALSFPRSASVSSPSTRGLLVTHELAVMGKNGRKRSPGAATSASVLTSADAPTGGGCSPGPGSSRLRHLQLDSPSFWQSASSNTPPSQDEGSDVSDVVWPTEDGEPCTPYGYCQAGSTSTLVPGSDRKARRPPHARNLSATSPLKPFAEPVVSNSRARDHDVVLTLPAGNMGGNLPKSPRPGDLLRSPRSDWSSPHAPTEGLGYWHMAPAQSSQRRPQCLPQDQGPCDMVQLRNRRCSSLKVPALGDFPPAPSPHRKSPRCVHGSGLRSFEPCPTWHPDMVGDARPSVSGASKSVYQPTSRSPRSPRFIPSPASTTDGFLWSSSQWRPTSAGTSPLKGPSRERYHQQSLSSSRQFPADAPTSPAPSNHWIKTNKMAEHLQQEAYLAALHLDNADNLTTQILPPWLSERSGPSIWQEHNESFHIGCAEAEMPLHSPHVSESARTASRLVRIASWEERWRLREPAKWEAGEVRDAHLLDGFDRPR